MPAVHELEQAGVLAPLALDARFRRWRRGSWEIVFLKLGRSRISGGPRSATDKLAAELIRRGVTASTAENLAREYAEDVIREKLHVYDQLICRRDARISRNPAGFLVQSIREDYEPPPGICRRPDLHPRRDGRVPRRPKSRARLADRERLAAASQVQDYLAQLSLEELIALEDRAVAVAPVLMADGYQRTKRSGQERLFHDYRDQILVRYVETLLESRPQPSAPTVSECATSVVSS